MFFAEPRASSRRSGSFGSRHSAKLISQKADSACSVVPSSPQTQFDLALTLLRHQLQQPMTSSSRGDVARSATESLLLAALGLAIPATGGIDEAVSPGTTPPLTKGQWTPTGTVTSGDLRRYKTELCRAFEERGLCRYGERCQFAHGMDELRALQRHPKYKTELCRTYHTSGYCPYGARCHFVHNPSTPAAPPPTPRDVEPDRPNGSCVPYGPVADGLPSRNLLSAAIEKAASPTDCTVQDVPVNDLVKSKVVASSVLQRRRPQVTLTLDPTPRASPPALTAPSRRSSASIDSGYGSSPTFPVIDVFSPPPPLPLKCALGPDGKSSGPLTAPLLTVCGRRPQSPGWFSGDANVYRPHRQPMEPRYPLGCPPVYPGRSREMSVPGAASRFDPHFVFDGLAVRP